MSFIKFYINISGCTTMEYHIPVPKGTCQESYVLDFVSKNPGTIPTKSAKGNWSLSVNIPKSDSNTTGPKKSETGPKKSETGPKSDTDPTGPKKSDPTGPKSDTDPTGPKKSVTGPKLKCRDGPGCTHSKCRYFHPERTPCRNGPTCTRQNCYYSHSQELSEASELSMASMASESSESNESDE